MKALLAALLAGLIFGLGLCLSGMTDPQNIIAFLDVTGHWSPKLAGVMVGAIAVHAAWLQGGPRSGPNDQGLSSLLPARARIDGALLAGAALFGVGWGLSGYCPGPAIVALGGGALGTVVFVAAMIAGMLLGDAARRADWSSPSTRSARPDVS